MLNTAPKIHTNDQTELLSSAMDSELSEQEWPQFFLLAQDHNLPNTWTSWHIIGDTLRENGVHASLVDEVARQLAQEPTVLAPTRKRWHPFRTEYMMPIAASVAAVAVVGFSVLRMGPANITTAPQVASTQNVQAVALAQPGPSTNLPVQQANLDQGRLARFVAAHGEYTPGINSPVMDASWQTTTEPSQ